MLAFQQAYFLELERDPELIHTQNILPNYLPFTHSIFLNLILSHKRFKIWHILNEVLRITIK